MRSHASFRASKLINLSTEARRDLTCNTMVDDPWYTDTERCPVWEAAMAIVKRINVHQDHPAARRRLVIALLTTWSTTNTTLPTALYDNDNLDVAQKRFARGLWDEFHVFVALPERRGDWLYMDVVAAEDHPLENVGGAQQQQVTMLSHMQPAPTPTTATPKRKSNPFASNNNNTPAPKKIKREDVIHIDDNDDQLDPEQPQQQQPPQPATPAAVKALADACRRLGCAQEFGEFMFDYQFERVYQQSRSQLLTANIARLEARVSELTDAVVWLKAANAVLEAENSDVKAECEDHQNKLEQIRDLAASILP